jgi:hypothetical protein
MAEEALAQMLRQQRGLRRVKALPLKKAGKEVFR